MNKERVTLSGVVVLLMVAMLTAPAAAMVAYGGLAAEPLGTDDGRQATRIQMPVAFEENVGQTNEQVKFLARGNGQTLFLAENEAVLVVPGSTATSLRMRLVGSNPNPTVKATDRLSGTANYFIGKDLSKWHSNVPTYGKIVYQNVYPGIDWVWYGSEGQLEYDFVVAAGADPRAIQLDIRGADRLALDSSGGLLLKTPSVEIRKSQPSAYQVADGRQQSISSGYQLRGGNRIAFWTGPYDTHRPLVIDPLIYSTYLGGSSMDSGMKGGVYVGGIFMTIDSAGNAFITGRTGSIDFPTTSGAYDTTYNGQADVFVTKLNADGSSLIYSTYLGGSSTEAAYDVAIDTNGNAYVTGGTISSNFPTTPGAYDTTYNGNPTASNEDAFITKLNAAGSALIYSTFLGGKKTDTGFGIALDANNNAYVTGSTFSSDFPTTPGAYDRTMSKEDGFITKLNAAGSALIYSTLLGGSGYDRGYGIAVNTQNEAYVTGTWAGIGLDAFVAKLSASGGSLGYLTYLSGSLRDEGSSIALSAEGNAYVTGMTQSTNFPTTPGAFQRTYNGGSSDTFVTELGADGSLIYSTYLGGSLGLDTGHQVVVDASGNAYVVGETGGGFPMTQDAFDPSYNGNVDAFLAKLNAAGSDLVYSTYLGGSGNEGGSGMAIDPAGDVYVSGMTASNDYPTTPGAFDTTYNGGRDAFVTKVDI